MAFFTCSMKLILASYGTISFKAGMHGARQGLDVIIFSIVTDVEVNGKDKARAEEFCKAMLSYFEAVYVEFKPKKENLFVFGKYALA